ncbi:MAG: acyl carrier protein [bacterium]|nr:acyl carrier protein [bacterium]
MSQTIVDQLKDIIVKLDVDIKLEEIEENVSLYEDGLGLDSIAIVDLIVLIEKEFSITIEDEELGAGLFKSLHSLSDFVRKKINA